LKVSDVIGRLQEVSRGHRSIRRVQRIVELLKIGSLLFLLIDSIQRCFEPNVQLAYLPIRVVVEWQFQLVQMVADIDLLRLAVVPLRHLNYFILNSRHLLKLANDLFISLLQPLALVFQLLVFIPRYLQLLHQLVGCLLAAGGRPLHVVFLLAVVVEHLLNLRHGVLFGLDDDISCIPHRHDLMPFHLLPVEDLGAEPAIAGKFQSLGDSVLLRFQLVYSFIEQEDFVLVSCAHLLVQLGYLVFVFVDQVLDGGFGVLPLLIVFGSVQVLAA